MENNIGEKVAISQEEKMSQEKGTKKDQIKKHASHA